MTLVDTGVWSDFFRGAPSHEADSLAKVIANDAVLSNGEPPRGGVESAETDGRTVFVVPLPDPGNRGRRSSSDRWRWALDSRPPARHTMCGGHTQEAAMATNLAIDPKLLEKALDVGGLRTKKETVTAALEEFIQRREQRKILEAMGTFDFRDDWDYKKDRQRR